MEDSLKIAHEMLTEKQNISRFLTQITNSQANLRNLKHKWDSLFPAFDDGTELQARNSNPKVSNKQVLDLLQARRTMRLKDIAAELGITSATVIQKLKTLIDEDHLYRVDVGMYSVESNQTDFAAGAN